MYNLYAGDCSFNKDYTNGCDTRIRNFVRHANIVQIAFYVNIQIF